MKKGINPTMVVLVGIILFVFWMVLLCGQPAFGQVIGVYGLKATEQPDNVIYVGEGLRYSSIASAVAACPDNGVIVLHPGRYTDRKVNIPSGKRLKIKGDGLWSRWVVSDSAFSCAADSLTLENFQLEATGSGQLFWLTPASGNRPNIWLKNMTLICSTLTFVESPVKHHC